MREGQVRRTSQSALYLIYVLFGKGEKGQIILMVVLLSLGLLEKK
jgi:hypothetical protein